ncbi:hypothetical protein EYF80_024176 [Liparis tanakae]|uniref:Uncharacterized protein n=1 Tax=Liparis tanakae TaxID=230148 RepID=A0A4Z2HIP6_9TELE|nr:hypothetical protein EYF80_024176 [Liparis tanakae]
MSLSHDVGISLHTEAEHRHPGNGCVHNQTESLWVTNGQEVHKRNQEEQVVVHHRISRPHGNKGVHVFILIRLVFVLVLVLVLIPSLHLQLLPVLKSLTQLRLSEAHIHFGPLPPSLVMESLVARQTSCPSVTFPDVLQQGALNAELGDDLQAGTRTDTQCPDHVNVVHASNGHHVLQIQRFKTLRDPQIICSNILELKHNDIVKTSDPD